jgi:hypothetical protein
MMDINKDDNNPEMIIDEKDDTIDIDKDLENKKSKR